MSLAQAYDVLRRQPQGNAQIDWSNPLATGLVFDMTPSLGYRNNVDGRMPSRFPGASLLANRLGMGHAVAQAADNGIDFGSYLALTTYPFSILVVADTVAEANRKWVLSLRNSGAAAGEAINFGVNCVATAGSSSDSSGSLYLFLLDATSQISPTTGAPGAVTAGVHQYGVTTDGTTITYYVDGKFHTSVAQVNSNSCFNAAQTVRVAGFGYNTNTRQFDRSQIITRLWNKRLITADDFARLADNPWQLYRKRNLVWMGGGAVGGAALAGAAAAQASASGALSVQVPLVGAATTVATASGALTTFVPLAGQAAAVTLASGALSITVSLTGAALANALAAGALSTQIALSGVALANLLAAGNLTGSGSGALAGNAAAEASATGALSTAVPLLGAASALAIAAGGMTTAIPLVGVAAAVSHVTGDLTVTVNGLSGAAVAQVLASGALSLQIALSGSAVANALAMGDLSGGPAGLVGDPGFTVRLARRSFTARLLKRNFTVRHAR